MQGRHVAPGQEGGREGEREREGKETREGRVDGTEWAGEMKKRYIEMDRRKNSELLKQEGNKSVTMEMSAYTVGFRKYSR